MNEQFPPPPPGVLIPPTLVTRAQASRILKKSAARIHQLSQKGCALETEDWHGTPMIPMWRVCLYQDAHPPKEPR